MPKNTLVINCDIRETRVALIEGGVIAELQIERAAARGTVGNIVLGKVTRVLPGMQAAFIDVGQERAAFLHVEDLIRPDDFEAYLSGSRRHEDAERFQKGEGGRRFGQSKPAGRADEDDERSALIASPGPIAAPIIIDEDDDEDDDDESVAAEAPSAPDREGAEDEAEGDDDDDEAEEGDDEAEEGDDEAEEGDEDAEEGDEDEAEEGDDDDGDDDDGDGDEDDDGDGDEDEDEDEAKEGDAAPEGAAGDDESETSDDDDDDETDDDDDDDDDEEEEQEEDAEDGEQDAAEEDVTSASDDAAGEGGAGEGGEAGARKRRRRRRKRGRDRAEPAAVAAPAPVRAAAPPARPAALRAPQAPSRSAPPNRERGREGSSRRDRNERDRRGGGGGGGLKQASRVARSVPITEVVKEGDEVIVQISKEPIGTKGARVTSHVSLPGRYAVYLPTVEHVGVSKRIGSARERTRLREVVEAMRPPKGGLIVRTVAEGLTKKSLKADIGYLVKVWEDVARKKEGAKAPAMLYSELDLVLKTARDLFTDEIENIVIDDKEQYARLHRFVEMFMPERAKDIHLYTGDEPIFDAYGIEDEISRALSRKVPLPSGGYLIIDQAEALTAIDVNTGRYVGKGSQNLEETAYKTNLEAVEEIAYQLRFRNIGGLVILDLIDMDIGQNREKVWRALEQLLAKDKAKTTINRISELGLIEMTRKRTRESLTRTMHETCFYCDGTGQIQSRTTIAYEILRQLRRERHTLPGYSVIVNAHPAVIDLMQGEERPAVVEAEKRYMRRIEFNPRREYHIEQFDLQGK